MFYTDQTPVEMWPTHSPPKIFFYQNGLKWPKMHFGSIFFFLENGFFQTHPPTKSGKFQIFFFFEPFPKSKLFSNWCQNDLHFTSKVVSNWSPMEFFSGFPFYIHHYVNIFHFIGLSKGAFGQRQQRLLLWGMLLKNEGFSGRESGNCGWCCYRCCGAYGK